MGQIHHRIVPLPACMPALLDRTVRHYIFLKCFAQYANFAVLQFVVARSQLTNEAVCRRLQTFFRVAYPLVTQFLNYCCVLFQLYNSPLTASLENCDLATSGLLSVTERKTSVGILILICHVKYQPNSASYS